MGKYEGLVGIAGTLGLISFGSLLLKIYETHNTTSLPWSWLLINLTAQCLAFTYGIVNKAYGIFIPCTLFILGLLYILYIKLKHGQYEKDKPKQL
jgi:hypothetical protein